MNKKLFYSCAFLLLWSICSLQAQTQIGSDIIGVSPNDQYGAAIALSANGNIIAVGSPTNGSGLGKVKIFQNTGNTWTQIGADIIGQGTPYSTNYQAGKSVALSADGSIVAIGSPYYSGPNWEKQYAGGVRIMKNVSGTSWTEIGYILGENAYDNSGNAISLSADGNTIAIGSTVNDGGGIGKAAGHVRVYQNINDIWTKIGDDIDGTAPNDAFGTSVALSADGSTVAAGAPFNSTSGSQTGNVRVFRIVNGNWTKMNTSINGGTKDYMFGKSVSLSSDGNIIAIGGWRYPSNGFNFNAGHVMIYQNLNNGYWKLLTEIIGETATDSSGQSVSLSADGTVVAIGAPSNDGGGDGSGQVRIYQNINGDWSQRGVDIDGKVAGDSAGTWVALSADGKIVASGSPSNGPNGILNAGTVTVYDISSTLASDSFVLENTAIYPNPATNTLFVNLQQDLNLREVHIYSILGQLIHSESDNVINVSNLEKGFYLVQVVTDKGSATQKIMVN